MKSFVLKTHPDPECPIVPSARWRIEIENLPELQTAGREGESKSKFITQL